MDEAAKITKLEKLRHGEQFRELDALTNVFCPFEAIGMVRQEIRHSNFLSYIMDPNRPHSFGSDFLLGFLKIIADENIDTDSLILKDARILREWRNIDILIELPSSSDVKSLVVAVELKIDAVESDAQLSKYKDIIEREYSSDKWDHSFVFLTKDGHSAREENQQHWSAVNLETVIAGFEKIAETNSFEGQSFDLAQSYFKMLRRHILPNKELEKLVSDIWKDHKEALGILCEHRPDYLGSIYKELKSRNMAEKFSESGFTICEEKSGIRMIRFYVEAWEDEKLKNANCNWSDAKRILLIEMGSWNKNEIRIALMIGPSDGGDIRDRLIKGLSEVGPEYSHVITSKSKYIRVASEVLLLDAQLLKAHENDDEIGPLCDSIIEKGNSFFEKTVKDCDVVIQLLLDN